MGPRECVLKFSDINSKLWSLLISFYDRQNFIGHADLYFIFSSFFHLQNS